MNQVIFLDLKFILTPESVYKTWPFDLKISHEAIEVLKVSSMANFKTVIVFNLQEILADIRLLYLQTEIEKQLMNYKIKLSGFYYCPHAGEDCLCKKPMAGLLFEAAGDLDIDLNSSWLMGDQLIDIEAGNRAGCKTVLIANGSETNWQLTPVRQPDFVSSSFYQGTAAIVLKNIYQKLFQARNAGLSLTA